jgi:hypothetical protein
VTILSLELINSSKIVVATQGTGVAAQSKESTVPAGNLIKLSEGIIIASDTLLSPGYLW